MNSICARCGRTGIGVLTGVVDAHERVKEHQSGREIHMAEHSTLVAGPPSSARIRAGHGVVPHNIAFWLVTGAFVAGHAFGTVPTPLGPLYARRDGLNSTAVTLAFAC